VNVTHFLLPGIVAAALAYVLTPAARRLALAIGAVDRPGPRKVHAGEIPRLGGLAVVAAVGIVGAILWQGGVGKVSRVADDLALGMTLGLLPILMVSIRDDIRPLPVVPKFLAHFAGATVAVMLGISLGPQIHIFGQQLEIGWLAVPLSILWIAGVTNAFNLVDGLDGLSAGLALISAGSLAGVSILVGNYGTATLAIVLAGALAGFLPYNIHPARVFLGDSGSTAIGFCLACLALRGGSTLTSGMAILGPMVVLGLPVAETLVSMLRRAVRRLQGSAVGTMFDADREHFHHRLMRLGIDQRRVVLILYGVGVALAAAGFGSMFMSHRKAAVLLGTIVVAAVVGLARLGYEEFSLFRGGGMLRVYEVPVMNRGLFIVFIDISLVALSLYGAAVLKYDDWRVVAHRNELGQLLALMPPIALAIFAAFGLYRRSWRLATLEDVVRASMAVVATSATTWLAAEFLWNRHLPVTFFMTQVLVLLLGVNGVRTSYRLLRDRRDRAVAEQGEPVVIYGAGQAGSMVIRELLANADLAMNPVGFLDDDEEKKGKTLSGYTIFGTGELATLIAAGRVNGVVVASDKIPEDRVREVAGLCLRTGVWMKHFRMQFAEEPDVAVQPSAK
jgi:UDP-GlcNAc:undecaprenyl-phosphate/decaprenyl-phosphate GlcNAc-1-phosphate transferase